MLSPFLKKKLEEKKLYQLYEEALCGHGLTEAGLSELQGADLLLVGAVAKAIRDALLEDAVQIAKDIREIADPKVVLPKAPAASSVSAGSSVSAASPISGVAASPISGVTVLREVAIERVRHPRHTIVLDVEAVGMELAQVGLTYGANALGNVNIAKSALPVVGQAPQLEQIEALSGLIRRAGGDPCWIDI